MVLIASRGIGNAGTMEIHDDGSTIVMRIRSSDGATNSGSVPIRAYFNGAWSGWTYVNYPAGSPWVNVWSQGVSSSQSVAFQVGDTGTWGFGAGGDLWAPVSRGPAPRVPDVPTNVGLDMITTTQMRYRFSGGSVGTGTLLRYQYQAWPTADFAGAGWASTGFSGEVIRTGLPPDTVLFWRARAVSTVGASAPSATVSARTLPRARLRNSGAWGDATPWLKVAGQWVRARPYERQGGVWTPAR